MHRVFARIFLCSKIVRDYLSLSWQKRNSFYHCVCVNPKWDSKRIVGDQKVLLSTPFSCFLSSSGPVKHWLWRYQLILCVQTWRSPQGINATTVVISCFLCGVWWDCVWAAQVCLFLKRHPGPCFVLWNEKKVAKMVSGKKIVKQSRRVTQTKITSESEHLDRATGASQSKPENLPCSGEGATFAGRLMSRAHLGLPTSKPF